MALSNAERQRRYIKRLKAKAAATPSPAPPAEDGGDDVLQELLSGQFFAAGVELIQPKPGEDGGALAIRQAAIDQFLSRPPLTALDMVNIMQEAGQTAALEIFERLTFEWIKALPQPAPPETKNLQRRKRRS